MLQLCNQIAGLVAVHDRCNGWTEFMFSSMLPKDLSILRPRDFYSISQAQTKCLQVSFPTKRIDAVENKFNTLRQEVIQQNQLIRHHSMSGDFIVSKWNGIKMAFAIVICNIFVEFLSLYFPVILLCRLIFRFLDVREETKER